MTDSNGREIKTGDIVTVSGGYFKTSNGLFYVSNLDMERGLWLHRVKKTGDLCVNSASSTQGWPLHSYCSDPMKNREARRHNEQNARIEVTDSVNTWHVAEHFRQEAQEARERGNAERADQYSAVAARLSENAAAPKQKEPEHGIKFYWNGIKVDGGRLIPCWYSLSGQTVSICARDYKDLPRQYFNVKNDTDIYTDYFDSDSTELTPEHPLYRFARYAALKGICGSRSYKTPSAEQAAEFASLKDPGQPTADDLAAVEEMKLAAENARRAREHAETLAAREASLRQHSEGRQYMEDVARKHPVVDGQPTVEIPFSESPYLYGLSHGMNNVFSVAAAEIILKHFDDLHPEHSGYDKTDFTVRWTDPETGEANSYAGRYDIGDKDGGLIAHIRAFGEHCTQDAQEKRQIAEIADLLEQYTEGGRVVNVELAPGVIDFLAAKKKQEQEKAERARQEIGDIYAAVAMLTDEQIEGAVFAIDPKDKEKLDVARFFLQELSRRDEKNALDVYRRWQAGA